MDPAAAAAVLPSNGRRIVRALEVVELTGEPFRATCRSRSRTIRPWSVGLDRNRPTWTSGWPPGWTACGRPGFVAEVAALAADGLRGGPTASRALGYAQVLAAARRRP